MNETRANYCAHNQDGSVCAACVGYIPDTRCGGLLHDSSLTSEPLAHCLPFADLIRKARKEQDLNLHELATVLGWDTAMLSAIERGIQAPPSCGDAQGERFAPWVGIMVGALGISNRTTLEQLERVMLIAAGEGLYWCGDEERVKVVREADDFCVCGVSRTEIYPWNHISQAIRDAQQGENPRRTWEKKWPNHCNACLGSGFTEGMACPWCRVRGKEVCPRCAVPAQPWGYGDCPDCSWSTTYDCLPPLIDEQQAQCLGNIRLAPR